MNESDGSGVKSAERALTILELFSARDTALTFSEVAERLGYPRSSLHGLLRTLSARGWLHYEAATRRFSLGLRAWEAGNAYLPAIELRRHAAAPLERLHHVLGSDARAAVLHCGDSVVVADAAGRIGARSPAHTSAAGRMLLAGLDRGERERHLARALRSGELTADVLHSELDEVRVRGWASAGSGDEGDAAGWLAVPVRVRGGAAALEVAQAVQRMTPDRRDEVLRLLQDAARQASGTAA